jgi:anti-sigma factor RsiW
MNCADVRDRIPELLLGDLTPERRTAVEAHLASCAECAEERATVEALLRGRPEVPAGLEARILDAVHAEVGGESDVLKLEPRRRRGVPAWALSAAALLVLAVGTPLMVTRMNDSTPLTPSEEFAFADEAVPSVWASDDGLIAGEPSFDGLSDEALLALLAELEAGA